MGGIILVVQVGPVLSHESLKAENLLLLQRISERLALKTEEGGMSRYVWAVSKSWARQGYILP